jgi:16S rRNA (guanine(527)-N(7))-methyltransferase RsmG
MPVKQLSNDIIDSSLRPYGVIGTALLCDQIRTYIDLLMRWNQKTSLTAVTDPIAILRFHFGESLLAAATVPIRHGRLADVGSGAGFPAVPIRMASEDLSLILIESNQKKAAFLAEVVRELRLKQVEVRRCRMADIDLGGAKVEFVTARALGIDNHFLNWSRGSLSSHGSVVLWLGDSDAVRISREEGWNWAHPIHIPQSESRVILRGSPI